MSEEQTQESKENSTEEIPELSIESLSDEELEAALNKTEPQEELSTPSEEIGKKPTMEEYAKIVQENESLKKQRSDKDRYITELQLKNKELIQNKEARIKEIQQTLNYADEDVVSVKDLSKHVEIHEAQKEIEALKQQGIIETNKAKIAELVPDFEMLKEDIATEAEKMYKKEDVEFFRKNPYLNEPKVIVMLAERVRDKQLLNTLAKTLKIKDKSFAKQLESVAKNASVKPLTNSNGTSASTDEDIALTQKQIISLSDKELDILLNKRQ